MIKTVLKMTGLILLALFLYFASDHPLWQHLSDRVWIAQYVEDQGSRAILLLLLTGILFTACGGPRQLIALLFGCLFGATLGISYTMLCIAASAAITYWLARIALKQPLGKYFPKKLQRFEQFVQIRPFGKILLLRLLPIGNNLLTNLCSGIISVPFQAFFLGSVLGYLPQTLIFALIGSGIGNGLPLSQTVSVIVIVICLYLFRYLAKPDNHAQNILSSSNHSSP